MIELAFLTLSVALGWGGGRSFLFLQRGKVSGKFTATYWLTLVASIATALLYAESVIGRLVRYYSINDVVVGIGAMALLGAFLVTVLVGKSQREPRT